ncbi:MAG: PQQ-like beta-propeller repeat protein [Gemmatimonadetes bacterium]|nr:PQQ-like beta-propeller repeat protein [Gemmatimonadota bacterium]
MYRANNETRRAGWGRWGRICALTGALAITAACQAPTDDGRQPRKDRVEVLFRVPMAGAGETWAPATDGQRLYADVARRIEAFDLNTGARQWSYARPKGGPSSLVVAGGRVMFAGDTAVALEAATGRELWRRPLPAFAGFCETDGTADAFYLGTTDHRVFALNAADGSLLWERDLGPDWEYRKGTVRGMTVSGDTVYAVVEHDTGINSHIGTGDTFALDRRTGQVLWHHRFGDGSGLSIYQSAARVAGGLLLNTANGENTFVALDRFTGREVWRVVGGASYFGPHEAPEVRGGVAFGAAHDQRAKAIDLASGRVLWETPVPGGTIYMALCGRVLLANYLRVGVFDPETGEFLGQLRREPENESVHTDFVVVGNRAYIFSTHALLALRCPV